MNLKSYRKCREDLLFDTLGLAGLIGSVLPAEVRPGSRFARAGGSQWNNHDLKMVADKLQDVLYRFDQVQHALGLWGHDARFGHGPAGSTNPVREEDQTMAEKKSAPKSTRPKAAPATKNPSALERDDAPPSKQPARNPRGGAGYSSSGRHG